MQWVHDPYEPCLPNRLKDFGELSRVAGLQTRSATFVVPASAGPACSWFTGRVRVPTRLELGASHEPKSPRRGAGARRKEDALASLRLRASAGYLEFVDPMHIQRSWIFRLGKSPLTC